MKKNQRLIFHLDVNSAYLSWEAVYRLQQGEKVDLREISSVIGGNEESRHGIVLAKSIPAKKYNIQTGETLYAARTKCPSLVCAPPRYDLYMKASAAMNDILQQYTDRIQRFSVDESFLDFSGMQNLYPDYMKLAYEIKDRIKKELGFTVNIGISTNKLLAKVASDLKKPDRIHTLFREEIKEKMWVLPVEDLFMVGRATAPKLHKLNIFTVGDLARFDLELLRHSLKSHGVMIWNFANGNEDSEIRMSNFSEMKGMGNSTTTSKDVSDRDMAYLFVRALSETVGMRLRNSQNCCQLISVSIRNKDFVSYSHQRKLHTPTDCTRKIAATACELFDEVWKGEPIRHFGVAIRELCSNEFYQYSLFDDRDIERQSEIDKIMDSIRIKYGSKSVFRSVFINSGILPMLGGVNEENNYPLMSSQL